MTLRQRLTSIVAALPPGSAVTLPADAVRAWLDAEPEDEVPPDAAHPESWRERVWTCAPDTLLGVREIAESVGRPESWVYRRTGPSAQERLPTQRLAGEVVIRAEDLRRWIRRHLEPAQ